jgi:hypothetical protein
MAKLGLKTLALEAVALSKEVILGMNESLEKFDLPTVSAFPESYLAFKAAAYEAMAVLPRLETDDGSAAKAQIELARNAVSRAREAFAEDEQMHAEIERELDEQMGPDSKPTM